VKRSLGFGENRGRYADEPDILCADVHIVCGGIIQSARACCMDCGRNTLHLLVWNHLQPTTRDHQDLEGKAMNILPALIGLFLLLGAVFGLSSYVSHENATVHIENPRVMPTKQLKQNIGYFHHDGRCYAYVVSSTYYGYKVLSFTQISCTGDIK
jgi:hypothetical protein